MPTPEELFARFAPRIEALTPAQLYGPTKDWGPRLVPGLLLEKDYHTTPRSGVRRQLTVYYAPLDHVNDRARIALVGIAPGKDALRVALGEAQRALRQGAGRHEVCSRATRKASFFGPMRTHLVEWLDDLGVHEALGLPTCARVFDEAHWHLVHATSVVRYPAFVGDENYTGSNPDVAHSGMLGRYAEWFATEELPRLPETLIFPLARSAMTLLDQRAQAGSLDRAQVVWEFPHPSPGGGSSDKRGRFFDLRDEMREQVCRWFAAHPVR